MLTDIKVKCCPFCGARALIRGNGWEPACGIQHVRFGCSSLRTDCIHPTIEFRYRQDDPTVSDHLVRMFNLWNSSNAKEDALEVADTLPSEKYLANTLVELVNQMIARSKDVETDCETEEVENE